MNRTQALRLALDCRLAVEANLAEMYGATHPSARNANKRRTDLHTAIETLQQPEQTRMKL
jgi:hypothetical protein